MARKIGFARQVNTGKSTVYSGKVDVSTGLTKKTAYRPFLKISNKGLKVESKNKKTAGGKGG